MKILLITNKFNLGGAETHVLELAVALKKDGHDVTVASAGGIYELVLKRNEIEHVSLPLDSKDIACLIESYSKLKKLISSEKFDIVHAHARIPAFICHLLQKKLKFHFVTTCHYNFKNKGYTKKYTYWGDHVFSISEDIDEYLLNTYGIRKKNISRAVNGINTDVYKKGNPLPELIEKYGLKGKKVVYTTSRLDEGSSEFIFSCMKAVIALRKKYPDIVYMVSGGGELYEKFLQTAESINAMYPSPIVIFTNAIFNVCDYLNMASVFIGPSRSALEAISSGVPTIVSGSQGHIGLFDKKTTEECIRTNFCSRKMFIASEQKFICELEKVLSMKKNELDEITKYGRDFILSNYSVEIMKNQYETEYERISKIGFKKNAVICGYYGNDNLGDEMLLSNIIFGLREQKPELQFSVISSDKRKTAREHCINAIGKYSIGKIVKELRESGNLIFGGGNIFQDKTSVRSFRYYAFIAKLARKNGCKVILMGNGIGPINNKKCKEKLKKIILSADYISLRDKESYEYVKSFKEDNVYLTGDLVTDTIPGKTEEPGGCFVLFPKEGKYDKTKLASCINELKERMGLECLIIPLNKKQDTKVAKYLCESADSLMEEKKDEFDILELLKNVSFTISMRLHGSVLSANVNVPFISIYDDPKLPNFAKDISDDFKTMCISYEEINEENLINAAKYAQYNRDSVAKNLDEAYLLRKKNVEGDFIRVSQILLK